MCQYRLAPVVILALLSSLSLGACATGLPRPAALVSPVPAQRIDNIGVSGGWWVNDLANFSSAVQRQVAELLFGAGGLELTAYRYNIGGGGTGVTVPYRVPQTFLVEPGHYDWTRDPGGRLFLRYASQFGVPDIIGFVTSAPALWTTNGKSCGGRLRPGVEQAYANYLTDVVSYFESQGIRINYVSPMNEPTLGFEDCRQEGMLVDFPQRAAIIRALGEALEVRAPRTRIIADESSRMSQFSAEAPQWIDLDGAARYVDKLAHHLYDHPRPEGFTEAMNVGRRYGKPLWATEVCCFTAIGAGLGPGYDPTITGALAMADVIYRAFAMANDTAFQWWVAVSAALGCDPQRPPSCPVTPNRAGSNDGLIYYDAAYGHNGNQRLYITKRYYALGQYSKFVRPGAVRHEVSSAPPGTQVLAFDHNGHWTLIVNNFNHGATRLSVRFAPQADIRPVSAHRTSASDSLSTVELPVVGGGSVSSTVPGRSITTYVLRQGGGI